MSYSLFPFKAEMVDNRHVAWLNDPEVVQFSEQRHRRHTIESQQRYLNEAQHLVLLIQSSGQDIGTLTVYYDMPNLTANLGILIGDKSFWGRGAGTYALRTIMDAEHRLEKFECGCREDNIPMQYLARKVGMRQEGFIPGHFRTDDGWRLGMCLYGVLR